MLYFVQGRSGTGKTHYTANVLAEKARQGSNKLLWLIPEQSSFESETMFLKLLGPSICRNISVMSFTRLYDMVMRVTGGLQSKIVPMTSIYIKNRQASLSLQIL